jgi:hypothetical protein
MKKIQFIGLPVLILVFGLTLVGCPTDSDDDDIWLKDLANPFIGKWESDIPSAQMHLIFDYKTDGTFDYEIPGMSAEEGGKGTGGYLVSGNLMVSYLSFEGVAGYTFKVVDNDTIDVTEIETVNEDGSFELGETAPFTRVANSPVNKENKPFVMDNPYIGKWLCEVTMEQGGTSIDVVMSYEYKTEGVIAEEFRMRLSGTDTPVGQDRVKDYPCFIVDNIDGDDVLVFFEDGGDFEAMPIRLDADDSDIMYMVEGQTTFEFARILP